MLSELVSWSISPLLYKSVFAVGILALYMIKYLHLTFYENHAQMELVFEEQMMGSLFFFPIIRMATSEAVSI